MVETFTSDTLPARSRAMAWNTLYSQHLNRVTFTPADRDGFAASLSLGQLGPIQFASMSAKRSNIERTRHDIVPGAPRLYSFLLQTRGSSVFQHCGQEARMNTGDFALCDSYAPHSFTVEDDSAVIMLRLEAATLRKYLPTPEQFCGLHLPNDIGLTGTVSAMVEQLHRKLETGFTSVYDTQLARHVLEMLSMTYAIGFGAQQTDMTAVVRGRQADIVRFVEDSLRDPKLSPASIAEGLRISPRYLRTIFAATGEKLSTYIIRRRLEECARQIADPAWAGHTLTEIAFTWGFNSAPHFTRTFHEHFGVTPSQYRKQGAN